MESYILAPTIIIAIALGLFVAYRMESSNMARTVHEWEHGLQYFNGRFERLLPGDTLR